ncbi:MAG: glycine--tRNA ligase [Mycoplasmatales bacterium]
MEITMDKIIAYAKNYGFVYQGSEIYGGLANSWDYGPLGVELKNNLKRLWYQEFITKNKNMVGLDSAIIMNPKVWEASGHIGGFSDPLIDCKDCKSRFRADKLIEDFSNGEVIGDSLTNEEMVQYINDNNISCPNCNKCNFTEIRSFNLMLKTHLGVLEDSSNATYLRPETAQGIFINFKNIQRTSRQKLPFGVGQIGKSFRNEITPGNFIFRTREFEQMEIEYFVKPGEELSQFDNLKEQINSFLKKINLKAKNYRFREHETEELAHYSNKTLDVEYKFPFGFGELWGLSSRTDFDLKAHQAMSGQDLTYLDPQSNERYLPYVLEPSVGVDRLFLSVLLDAYEEEEIGNNDTREVLKISHYLAPYQIAVLPLVKKLSPKADEVYQILNENFRVDTDLSGKIGKRYRRQDVIGTPYCVTIDYDSLEADTVTVRDRDSMEQEVIKIAELNNYFINKLK